MRFRWFNKIRASVTGYFWIPCPLCGEMFGGHEMGGTVYLYGDAKSRGGRIVCPKHPGDYVAPSAPSEMYRTSLDVELSEECGF